MAVVRYISIFLVVFFNFSGSYCYIPDSEEITYSEGSTIRHSNGQIRKDRNSPIHPRHPECQIMANLMNRKKQILVRCSSNHIGSKEELPAEKWRVLKHICAEDLQCDDTKDNVFGERLWPAELRYFRMSFDDGHSPCSMRLLCICPEEIMFPDFQGRGVQDSLDSLLSS